MEVAEDGGLTEAEFDAAGELYPLCHALAHLLGN